MSTTSSSTTPHSAASVLFVGVQSIPSSFLVFAPCGSTSFCWCPPTTTTLCWSSGRESTSRMSWVLSSWSSNTSSSPADAPPVLLTVLLAPPFAIIAPPAARSPPTSWRSGATLAELVFEVRAESSVELPGGVQRGGGGVALLATFGGALTAAEDRGVTGAAGASVGGTVVGAPLVGATVVGARLLGAAPDAASMAGVRRSKQPGVKAT